MSIADCLLITAVLLGPVITVQLNRHLDNKREVRTGREKLSMNLRSINKHPIWGLLMGAGVGLVAGMAWTLILSESGRADDRMSGSVQGFAFLYAFVLTAIAGYFVVKGLLGFRRLRKERLEKLSGN